MEELKNLMSARDWIFLIVGFVSGGTMGAVIKGAIDSYNSRVQPVSFKIEIVEFFKGTLGSSSLKAELMLDDGTNLRHIQNLFLATLLIQNNGNVALETFKFGATLGENDVAIYSEPEEGDTHNKLFQITPVSLQAPVRSISYEAKPFNRGRQYSFKIYICIPETHDEPGQIKLVNSHDLKFVPMTNYKQTFLEIFTGVATSFVKEMVFRLR